MSGDGRTMAEQGLELEIVQVYPELARQIRQLMEGRLNTMNQVLKLNEALKSFMLEREHWSAAVESLEKINDLTEAHLERTTYRYLKAIRDTPEE